MGQKITSRRNCFPRHPGSAQNETGVVASLMACGIDSPLSLTFEVRCVGSWDKAEHGTMRSQGCTGRSSSDADQSDSTWDTGMYLPPGVFIWDGSKREKGQGHRA